MKVIITGASGMVGKAVLLECFERFEIKEVLSIVRRSTKIEHEKLKELIHSDFSDFSGILENLKGYDACFFCMGVSSAGMKEEEYKKITYDYTLAFAKQVYQVNRGMTFIYVSGKGTDSSEKGSIMWARVKGKTENDLLKMGFHQAFMFRPNAIIPQKGIKSRTKLYQFMYDYALWLIKIVKWLSPQSVVNTTQLGQAMINVALGGYQKEIVESGDILELAKPR